MASIEVISEKGVGGGIFHGNTELIPNLNEARRISQAGGTPLLRAHLFHNSGTRGIYYHKFKDIDGKRKNRSTGIPIDQPEHAQRVADEMLRTEFEKASPSKLSPPKLLSELYDLVIRDQEDTGRSKGQIKNMKASKQKLIEAFGNVPFVELDYQDFQRFIRERTLALPENRYIRFTDKNAIKGAQTALNYAVNNGWIARHYCKGLRMPKTLPSQRHSIDIAEFCNGIDLYRSASYVERVALLSSMILMYTGLRPSELRRVKLDHVDFKGGFLDMAEQMELPVKDRPVTLLPLSEAALWALRQLRLVRSEYLVQERITTPDPELLLSTRGHSICDRTFSDWFSKFARKAWPSKRLTLYNFRRGFATEMKAAGLSGEDVALAMGKRTWDTTITYLDSNRCQRLATALPFISKLPMPKEVMNL
jgi:integrase